MVTAFYAALSGLFLVFLSVHVVRGRVRANRAHGDGDDLDLRQRCRAQGNFVEYTPLYLFLLALAETQQLSLYAVHFFGIAFLVGRASHAYGLLKIERPRADGGVDGSIRYRQIGALLTFGCIALISLILLWQWFMVRGVF